MSTLLLTAQNQIRLLLVGDCGALYDDPGADDLEPALQEAMQALEPVF